MKIARQEWTRIASIIEFPLPSETIDIVPKDLIYFDAAIRSVLCQVVIVTMSVWFIF